MKTISTQEESPSNKGEAELDEKIKLAVKNQQLLQNIFNNSPTATAVLDGPEHIYILANKAYQKLFNRQTNDFLGKRIHEVFPELIGTEAFDLVDQVYETGESFTTPEYPLLVDVNNDNVLRQNFYNFSLAPLKNDSGAIYAVIAMIYDITEQVELRKKIEENEKEIREIKEQLELSIQAGKIGVWSWNVKKDILTWSNEQKEIYGFSASETITNAAQFNTLIFPEDLKRIQDDQSANTKSDHEYNFRIIRKNDSEIRWIKSRARNTLDPQGALQFISGVNIDVTDEVIALNKIQESEEALAHQKQLLESVTENTDMALFLMDQKQYCVYMNKAAEKMTGFTQEELKGKQLHYYVHHSHPDGSPFPLEECPIDNALPSLNRMKGEEVFVHKDGFFYPVAFTASPIMFNGEAIGTVIEIRETTEDKKKEQELKESESRFWGIADALPALIWTLDTQGLSSYYNKTFLDFIGTSKGEDISDWKKIVHPDDFQSSFDTINAAIALKSSYALENRLLRADGQWRWVMAQGNPLIGANNEFLGFVGSSVDITDRKQFENELMEAKTVAENAAKSRQQFLSNMSHEIRTPLNSILGFANVLLKTELDTEQKEFVQAIKTSGKSLNLLINDILDLAKVDAGKMTFETQPFEIHNSISSILHSFDMKIREKNIKLIEEYDSNIPPILLGDTLRLNQILFNLISNAVKFTHKGKIKLTVELLSESAEDVMLKFVVNDSGIGIADNKLNSIFNIFEQAEHNTATSYGGSGLGLAIVKQLVEAQGGSMSVKSQPGEGSTFGFIMSFEKTNLKLEEENEILKPDPEIKNLRVLVVEDVPLNQLLIKIILNDFGFEQEIVSNGKLAIDKMQTNTYDIILMDLQMPEMNGFEATEYIRNSMNSQIPIIALTADVTTVDISKCKEFGMNDYISKPINENLLYNKILELVKNK